MPSVEVLFWFLLLQILKLFICVLFVGTIYLNNVFIRVFGTMRFSPIFFEISGVHQVKGRCGLVPRKLELLTVISFMGQKLTVSFWDSFQSSLVHEGFLDVRLPLRFFLGPGAKKSTKKEMYRKLSDVDLLKRFDLKQKSCKTLNLNHQKSGSQCTAEKVNPLVKAEALCHLTLLP